MRARSVSDYDYVATSFFETDPRALSGFYCRRISWWSLASARLLLVVDVFYMATRIRVVLSVDNLIMRQ